MPPERRPPLEFPTFNDADLARRNGHDGRCPTDAACRSRRCVPMLKLMRARALEQRLDEESKPHVRKAVS
jgi:hypothetical protein